MHVAILAGGKGTRLWPLSDEKTPKQFLQLPYDQSLLEQTVARSRGLVDRDHLWIITVASQVEETRRLLPDFPTSQIIAEPTGRNTAPAAALATIWIESKTGQPVTVLLLPADHYISNSAKFVKRMNVGMKRAAEGKSLITFGLKIPSPETDFGYIEIQPGRSGQIQKVKRFIEKPAVAKAKVYAKSGKHFWNSGMFAWRSDFFRTELARHAKEIYSPLVRLNWKDALPPEGLPGVYEKLPNISIDYALMEKSKSVEVVPSQFEWSDVGTWAAVCDAVQKKKTDNIVIGRGQVVDGKGNMIRSPNKPIIVFGLDNLVVVDSPDATLVTTREKSRHLKKLIEQLALQGTARKRLT